MVRADDYVTVVRQIDLRAGMDPIEVHMKRGETIRGRVVDTQGRPVSGIAVTASSGLDPVTYAEFVTLKTDGEGRFVWRGVPRDGAMVTFFSQKYVLVRKELKPAATEHVITLHRPLHISGSVTDAENAKPIRDFRVLPVGDQIMDPFRGSRVRTTGGPPRAEPGHYDIRPGMVQQMMSEQTGDSFRFRIEAEGYEPFESRPFKSEEENVTYDVKLKRGDWLAGTVRSAEGTPLADALVVLARPDQFITVENRRLQQPLRALHVVKTAADSQFTFPKPTDPFGLLVLHEGGQALVTSEDFAGSHDITIRPWGRLEGVVRIGAKPGVKRKVRLDVMGPFGDDRPHVHHECTTVSDEQGHFVFERVLPGEGDVSYYLGRPADPITQSHASHVKILSGRTTWITIGGRGRPVIGRLTLPPGTNARDGVEWNTLRNHVIEDFSVDRSLRFSRDVDEGFHRYGVSIRGDGTFRVEDVVPGHYVLEIYVNRKQGRGLLVLDEEEEIGTLKHHFVVTQIPGGRTDDPLDLGALALRPQKELRPGDRAPELKGMTLSGEPFRLSDLRGKVVLLHFWTHLRPDGARCLKAVYTAFGSNKRFAMIGVNTSIGKLAKEQITKLGIAWPQIVFEDDDAEPVKEAFGLPLGAVGFLNPPSVLIGPDGKIIAVVSEARELLSAVSEAMHAASKPATES